MKTFRVSSSSSSSSVTVVMMVLTSILLLLETNVVDASSSSNANANTNTPPPSSHTCPNTPHHNNCQNNHHPHNHQREAKPIVTPQSPNKDTTTPTPPLLKLTLQEKWPKSPNSWVLRFSLPLTHSYLWSHQHHPTKDDEEKENQEDLLSMPTCISVHYNSTTSQKVKSTTTTAVLVKKSYSPISHPSTPGYFDLLVKSYPPPPTTASSSSSSSSSSQSSSDGVGSYICSLQPGQTMMATLKPQRLIHGSPQIVGRQWTHVGLVAGGTGIAPLFQLAKILLEEDSDSTTSIHVLSINRKQEDILLQEELDQLVQEYPDRFQVTYSLTDPHYMNSDNHEWTGRTGRGSVEMVRAALPPPQSFATATITTPQGGDLDPSSSSSLPYSTMIFVCGTDGFVDTWGGPVGRAPPLANGKKGPKIQGPLLGILKEAGYDESEVFKY